MQQVKPFHEAYFVPTDCRIFQLNLIDFVLFICDNKPAYESSWYSFISTVTWHMIKAIVHYVWA